MVKQIYRVKRDGRKCVVSDSTPSIKTPAELTLAIKGKEVRRVTFKDPIVESGQAKPEMPELKKKLLLHKSESHPRCLTGLPHWQQRQLERLRDNELKKRNMAWVPKRSPQIENGVPVPVVSAEVKEGKCGAGRSRKYSSHHRRPRTAQHPCSSTVPSKPASRNLSPAETSDLFRLFTLWWTGSASPSR